MQFREIGDDTPTNPAPAPSLPSNAISGLVAQADGDGLGITVSFTVATVIGVGLIQILRYGQNSENAAGVIQQPNRQDGLTSYDDRDASIHATQQFYWVRVWNSTIAYFDDYGPVTATLVAPVAAPNDAVTWIDASRSRGVPPSVPIYVTVQLKPGIDFRSLKIFVAGYRGNVADTQIAEVTGTSASFFLERTGEAITIKAAVVNSAGVVQSLVAVPSVQATLYMHDAASTPPARVRTLNCLEGLTTTEVTFLAGPEPFVVGYKLYRAAVGAGFGAAVLVTRIPVTSATSYAIQDATKGRLIYEWYVTAVGVAGDSLPSLALQPSVTF